MARSVAIAHVSFTTTQLLETGAIGLVAGVLGGMAGVGGSMIMLPGLHVVFGDTPPAIHHLYMAAAMTVNVAVSAPAARRHSLAGTTRRDLLPTLLISTAIAIVAGVLIGNRVPGQVLKYMLAGFLAIYCIFNLVRILKNAPEHAREHERTSRRNLIISGASTGMLGGLLGLGGGVLLVPMLQMLCRVPLKASIATSSTVMCMTAVIGAGLKLSTLPEGQSWQRALLLAALMAPSAMIGGYFGAHLTQKLPVRIVRVVVTVLIGVVAARMVM